MTTSYLPLRRSDFFRATMTEGCGNDGYIEIAPDGSQYHVVATVDRQIVQDLKFWISSDDGRGFYVIVHGSIGPIHSLPAKAARQFYNQRRDLCTTENV